MIQATQNLSIQYIGQHLDLRVGGWRERESHLLARNPSGLCTELMGVAQLVKNLSTMWETWIWSLGWEDPLAKGKATHSSILAWRIPWTTKSMGSQRVELNWAIFTHFFFPHKSLDSKMKEKNKIPFSSHVFPHSEIHRYPFPFLKQKNPVHTALDKGNWLGHNSSVGPQSVLRASQTAKVKNLPVSAGEARDMGSIPGLGRSPGERRGDLL